MKNIYDVIVIGAGFSGLASGLELKAHNANFLILEADNRVGGRSLTQLATDGSIIELGGQWIGAKHSQMKDLVKRYSLKTYLTPPFPQGQDMIEYGHKLVVGDQKSAEVIEAFAKIDQLAAELDLAKPFDHPQAESWANMTLTTWMKKHHYNEQTTEVANRILNGALLSAEESTASFLSTLFYIASNSGLGYLISFKGGDLESRVNGGMNSLAQKMAQEIGQDKIKLNDAVLKVNSENSSYAIISTKHNQYYAKKIIFTTPAPVLKTIEFSPQIPQEYQSFWNSYVPGQVLKIHFVFKTPFWRKDNKTGSFLKFSEYLTEIVDNSVPNQSNGILSGFVYGKQKIAFLKNAPTIKERQAILAKELAVAFGPQALDFVEYFEYDWNQAKYHSGCYSASIGLGGWTKFAPQVKGQSYQNFYWGGSEQSFVWVGHFEGAVDIGYKLAKQVVKDLK